MQKILYHRDLLQSVLDGTKPMTRRGAFYHEFTDGMDERLVSGRLEVYDGETLVARSRYAVGEVVAVARPYKDLADGRTWINGEHMGISVKHAMQLPGWGNAMFVSAGLMPDRLRVESVKTERLRDISDEDCLMEGVFERTEPLPWQEFFPEYTFGSGTCQAESPRKAFEAMLAKCCKPRDLWDRNPYVFAYTMRREGR